MIIFCLHLVLFLIHCVPLQHHVNGANLVLIVLFLLGVEEQKHKVEARTMGREASSCALRKSNVALEIIPFTTSSCVHSEHEEEEEA